MLINKKLLIRCGANLLALGAVLLCVFLPMLLPAGAVAFWIHWTCQGISWLLAWAGKVMAVCFAGGIFSLLLFAALRNRIYTVFAGAAVLFCAAGLLIFLSGIPPMLVSYLATGDAQICRLQRMLQQQQVLSQN